MRIMGYECPNRAAVDKVPPMDAQKPLRRERFLQRL